MVHKRFWYIVSWIPRVEGKVPGWPGVSMNPILSLACHSVPQALMQTSSLRARRIWPRVRGSF